MVKIEELDTKFVDGIALCLLKYNGKDKVVEFEDNNPISVFFDDAFRANQYIEKVIVPNGVTDIGTHCFEFCMSLKEILLPKTIKYFYQYAFSRCNIEEISIPGSMEQINSYSFSSCINLKKVIIEDGVKEILFNAFEKCPNLKEVIVPASIKKIDANAFFESPKVKIIKLNEINKSINKEAISISDHEMLREKKEESNQSFSTRAEKIELSKNKTANIFKKRYYSDYED